MAAGSNLHRKHYERIENQAHDQAGKGLHGCVMNCGLARDHSMDVSNDPRFFANSVMDKRMSAFKSLTFVSSVMYGTSLYQCFALKKDFDFSKHTDYTLFIPMAYWQMAGFFIALGTTMLCMLAVFVLAHQLFYANRLITSGPTGFEQAAVFYLTRSIVMWRHLAIKALFNGLQGFVGLMGIQLFCKFYKDADAVQVRSHFVWAANVVNGTSINDGVSIIHAPLQHKLDMKVHTILAYIVLIICCCMALTLWYVRKAHVTVFTKNYEAVKAMTIPLEEHLRKMSHRADLILDT